MKILVLLSTLFVIGSVIGYVLELFYRRIFSQKKWVNPGFLLGPYLPIYGFGVIILFLVSNINLCIPYLALDIVIRILIIGVGMTLIEFIAGLVFIKGMKMKLWDYSDRKGNIMGIICPLFSFIWLVVGSLYFFFVNPFLVTAINWISENLIYTYFIGGVIGAIVVDTAYSIHLGVKLKQFNEHRTVRYEELRKTIRDKIKKLRNN